MTEVEIRADERRRIVQAIQRLTRADYSPSNIWRHYYHSTTGDWVDLREVIKAVLTDGVSVARGHTVSPSPTDGSAE
jgi:hypothetical protein